MTTSPKSCRTIDTLTSMPTVIRRNRFSDARPEDLVAIATRSALTLVIESTFSASSCQVAAAAFTEGWGGYLGVEPRFQKLGMDSNLFEAGRTEPGLEAYFSRAKDNLCAQRAAMSPLLAPADYLRLAFSEFWPYGFDVARLHPGRIANFGILRRFDVGGLVEPHNDRPVEDLPNNGVLLSMETFFAFNMFLEVPSRGGALELWDFAPTLAEYEALKVRGNYYLDRALIGAPDVVLEPTVGSLVIFRADNVHAVTPVESGRRIAAGGFLGFRGSRYPLVGHA